MLPTHESKTTQHKFSGRKGVGDEVLELPIRNMQDDTQVSWLATKGLIPCPQDPWNQTQQHALYWGPNPQDLWEQTKQHPLVQIPRAFENKHNNVPWFPGYAALCEQLQQQLQHWGPHSPRKADHVSLRGKRATYTEHFIPSRGYLLLENET